jgi:hypothetical protein
MGPLWQVSTNGLAPLHTTRNNITKTRHNTVILLTNHFPPLITVNEISEVVLLREIELYKTFKQILHLKRYSLTASCDMQSDHAVQFYIRTVSQQTQTNMDKVHDSPYKFLSIKGRQTFCTVSLYCHEVSVQWKIIQLQAYRGPSLSFVFKTSY